MIRPFTSHVTAALATCLALLACAPEPVPQDAVPPSGDSTRPLIYGDLLGVNYTWAADRHIVSPAGPWTRLPFRHVRYFQMMEKDYGAGATPGSAALAPCTDVANPWSCPERSMRQHLVRVAALRQLYPDGLIWIAPEVLAGRGWPCKGWTVAELGTDPELAGYHWARAALQTYGAVGGDIVLAMGNEEWCAEEGRAEAMNAWRRGVVRAHRENPSCQLAVDARHVRPRTWEGKLLPESVEAVAPEVWAYVDSIGGWADYHAHGIERGRFLPRDRAHEAADFRDFFAWSAWLKSRYPGIRRAVGEVAYTSSAPGVVPDDTYKLADWPTYRNLIERLVAGGADAVFLYQAAEQPSPEGAFSGSGVWPALRNELESFGREALPEPGRD